MDIFRTAQPHSIAFGGVLPNITEAILVDEISTKVRIYPPKVIREDFKYYFADFVRKWGSPPRLRIFFGKKGVTDLGGTPLPPFTDFSPKIFLQKGL